MEKKTSPVVYILLIAFVIASGAFIVHRLKQNAEDRKAIDKIEGDLQKMEEDNSKPRAN